MFKGFLNEIKNVAVNRATNRINSMVNDALGGLPGLPMNRGRVSTAQNRLEHQTHLMVRWSCTQKI